MVKFPAYFKITQILLGLVLLFYVLFLAQDILKPLLFALILAILLNPLTNFFSRIGIGRVLSISISVILLCLVIGGILFFIGYQVSLFREALPELKKKFFLLSEQAIGWVTENFN